MSLVQEPITNWAVVPDHKIDKETGELVESMRRQLIEEGFGELQLQVMYMDKGKRQIVGVSGSFKPRQKPAENQDQAKTRLVRLLTSMTKNSPPKKLAWAVTYSRVYIDV